MKYLIIKAFLLALPFFISFMFLISASTSEKRIHFLTGKITELKEIKRGFIAKALMHENQAQRLQFINGEELEAKKHAILASKYRLASKKVQQVINQLKKEKCTLCKEMA
jgi:ribosomal protein L9